MIFVNIRSMSTNYSRGNPPPKKKKKNPQFYTCDKLKLHFQLCQFKFYKRQSKSPSQFDKIQHEKYNTSTHKKFCLTVRGKTSTKKKCEIYIGTIKSIKLIYHMYKTIFSPLNPITKQQSQSDFYFYFFFIMHCYQ